MMTDERPATMSITEAAALIGISYMSLSRAIKRGDIPAIRIGQRTQIPRHIVDRLIADGNTKAAS